MHFLLLRFGLFAITGFENRLDFGLYTRYEPAAVVDDKSTDPKDVRTEKNIELITLHRAMKKLDMDMDYSAVVDPLLADQGPALAHIPRLIKTIQRLGKIKEEFLLEREQQRAAPLVAPAESAIATQIHLTHSIESSPNNADSGRGHAAIRIEDERPLPAFKLRKN